LNRQQTPEERQKEKNAKEEALPGVSSWRSFWRSSGGSIRF
jgi:hypothetical protein